jgi:outer membrane murein-binding lipoprotein Lpp
MRKTTWLLPLVLAGCQQPADNQIRRDEYERLQTRVAQLEGQIDALKAKQQAKQEAAPTVTKAPPAPERKPKNAYQLVGTSFKNEGDHFYADRHKCESARQTLLDAWSADDERNRKRGIVFTSRPAPACLPI